MKIRRSILKEKLFLFLSANCCALWAAPNTPACSSVSLTGSMIIVCEKNDTETVELWREGRTTKPQYLHLKMKKHPKSFVFTLVRFGQPIKTTVFGLSFYIVCQQLWVGISVLQRVRERFNMEYYHVHDSSWIHASLLVILIWFPSGYVFEYIIIAYFTGCWHFLLVIYS